MSSFAPTAPSFGADTTPWEPTSVIPPRRLGQLLSEARASRGWTIDDAAEASGGSVGHWDLAAAERGTSDLDDSVLAEICSLYGVNTGSLVPSRSKLIVDMAEGRLWVSETQHKAKISARSPREDVLARYLSMVYVMRDIEPGEHMHMRQADIEVLGSALRAGSDTVSSDLERLMANPHLGVSWRTRLLSRKFLVPAAGLLVAFCGAGALIVTSGDSGNVSAEPPASAPAQVKGTSAVAPPAEVGTAVVQERNADGTPGSVVVRGG
jgi:transcriptional regulator with XRE-family HTH domain